MGATGTFERSFLSIDIWDRLVPAPRLCAPLVLILGLGRRRLLHSKPRRIDGEIIFPASPGLGTAHRLSQARLDAIDALRRNRLSPLFRTRGGLVAIHRPAGTDRLLQSLDLAVCRRGIVWAADGASFRVPHVASPASSRRLSRCWRRRSEDQPHRDRNGRVIDCATRTPLHGQDAAGRISAPADVYSLGLSKGSPEQVNR